MNILSSFIQYAIKTLEKANIAEAKLEGRLLAEYVSGTTRIDVLKTPQKPIPLSLQKDLQDTLKRRIDGEPVFRIIGKREFYGLPFTLSKDTLEPRDDTGALIDLLLPILQTQEYPTILDMGTGTGIIAITLLHEIKTATAIGVDISQDALATAFQNAKLNSVEKRFTPLLSDWFENVKGKFDFIVSNPPYIPQADLAHLQKEVLKFDPHRALDGGVDGLDFYRSLALHSKQFLTKNGKVAVEIGIDQENDIEQLFKDEGFILTASCKDLGDITRALLFSASN